MLKHRSKKGDKLSKGDLEIEDKEDVKETRIKEAEHEHMLPLKEFMTNRQSGNFHFSADSVKKESNQKQNTSVDKLEVNS